MAINPGIALQGQPMNLMQAIQGGYQTGEHIRNRSLRDALMNQQVKSGQLGLDQGAQSLQLGGQQLALGQQTQQMNQQTMDQNGQALATGQAQASMRQAQTVNAAAQALSQAPLEERAGILARMSPQLQQAGIDPSRITPDDLSDQGLSQILQATQGMMQQQQPQQPPDDPAAVREYQYFSNLSPEDQAKYINMKRSATGYNANDVRMVQDPTDPTRSVPVTEDGAPVRSQSEQQEELSTQQATGAAQERAATNAIETSQRAFERLPAVRTAIGNLDEAIRLVEEEGANTGTIASRFPSIQSASIELDNIQSQLGLDVIGNTTFGALSESELRFALSAALPTNLPPERLKRWLERKKSTQQELSRYLEDAATYLGRPGNTVSDFLDLQRGRQASGRPREERQQQPPQIMQMTIQQLRDMDMSNMTPEQLDEAGRRFDELQAEEMR